MSFFSFSLCFGQVLPQCVGTTAIGSQYIAAGWTSAQLVAACCSVSYSVGMQGLQADGAILFWCYFLSATFSSLFWTQFQRLFSGRHDHRRHYPR